MTEYPPGLKIAPMTTWPGEQTAERKRSPFSATMPKTLALLRRELYYLGAETSVLEVAIPPEQFRIDGNPRAAARATHPGVVLSLPATDHGPLRYPADRFDTWQGNLRAIALGLEALRQVDRYGITPHGEQYTGFKALEQAKSGPMTRDQAVAELAMWAKWPADQLGFVRVDEAYRMAAKYTHPDAGGSVEQFQRLQQIMAVINGGKANG